MADDKKKPGVIARLFGKKTKADHGPASGAMAQEEVPALDLVPSDTSEVVAQAEAAFKERVFEKMLRNLPKPTYRCAGQKQHNPAGFVLTEWHTDGARVDEWWCDNCWVPINNESELLIIGVNGAPKCAKCETALVDGAKRRPVVVKVRPCLRCGLIFWDKMEV